MNENPNTAPGTGIICLPADSYDCTIFFNSTMSGCALRVSGCPTMIFGVMALLVSLDLCANVRAEPMRGHPDAPYFREMLGSDARSLVRALDDAGPGIAACDIDGNSLIGASADAVARTAVTAVARRLGVQPPPVPTIPVTPLTIATHVQGRA